MIQGETHTLPLTDLIQWIALTQRTGRLVIAQAEANMHLYFARGEIAAAFFDGHVLESPEKVCAALGAALAWRASRFAFSDCPLPERVLAGSLHLSPERLLLAATARRDQTQQAKTAAGLGDWADAGDYSATFTLADSLRLQVIDRLLKEDFKVPVMPQLAIRVIDLTRNEDFSLRDLGNLILTDQAVAARLLRYANSVVYSGAREVNSLALAVQRLGANEVVNIVLAASLQTRRMGYDLFTAEKRRLNLHASTTAFIARSLAARAGLNSSLGFLCGLLMDFGTTVLYSVVQQVLAGRARSEPLPAQVIAEIVRDYHPRIGRAVGEKWQLPLAIIETMSHHHCLAEATAEQPYVAVSALADVLAALALEPPRAVLEEVLRKVSPERLLAHPAARLINLNPGGAIAVLEDLVQHVDQAREFTLD